MNLNFALLAAFLSALTLSGCGAEAPEVSETGASVYDPKPYSEVTHPDWVKDAVIYQLNTRQATPEGTFRAAQAHLPRIKALGADIVWLMPIHPIGEENRKGGLGSPYSVKDYFGINPEFGTEADLRAFISEAHSLGLKVILDWVANHSAWDNAMRFEHPDWYEKDYKGDFRPTPWWDWSDIIDLDYRQPGLRKTMTEAMTYWVREFDIDGYRCDVAGFVPLDFWEHVRTELDKIKPVFMLAEWESRDMHRKAFNATYAWSQHEAIQDVAQGKVSDLSALYVYYSWNESAYPQNALRMTHIANHDINSWHGTQFDNFGDALEPAIVLSVVGEGIPMIYNGQEAGNRKRLAFFEKDEIVWQSHPIGDLYAKLFQLKKQNSALWNGEWGARMVHVPNSNQSTVLSFVRQDEKSKIMVILNLSAEPQTVRFDGTLFPDDYADYFAGERLELLSDAEMTLKPWAYKVLVADK